MKKIAILGSTGSIGTQTLDVVREHSDELQVVALAAGSNKERLKEQIKEFHPKLVSLSDEKKAQELKEELAGEQVEVVCGMEGLIEVAGADSADVVVTAVVVSVSEVLIVSVTSVILLVDIVVVYAVSKVMGSVVVIVIG